MAFKDGLLRMGFGFKMDGLQFDGWCGKGVLGIRVRVLLLSLFL